jgi:hypothetical protein
MSQPLTHNPTSAATTTLDHPSHHPRRHRPPQGGLRHHRRLAGGVRAVRAVGPRGPLSGRATAEQLAHDRPVKQSAAIVASWARYCEGVDEHGQPIEIVDNIADDLRRRAANLADEPLEFLDNREVFATATSVPPRRPACTNWRSYRKNKRSLEGINPALPVLLSFRADCEAKLLKPRGWAEHRECVVNAGQRCTAQRRRVHRSDRRTTRDWR